MNNDDDGEIATVFEPEITEIDSQVEPGRISGYALNNANKYSRRQFARIAGIIPRNWWFFHLISVRDEAERHQLETYDDESALPLAKRDKSIIFQKIAGAIVAGGIGIFCLSFLSFLCYLWWIRAGS